MHQKSFRCRAPSEELKHFFGLLAKPRGEEDREEKQKNGKEGEGRNEEREGNLAPLGISKSRRRYLEWGYSAIEKY